MRSATIPFRPQVYSSLRHLAPEFQPFVPN
jgi:hypothetical protein